MIDEDFDNNHSHIFWSYHTEYCHSLSCWVMIWAQNRAYWFCTVQISYFNRCIIVKSWEWLKITLSKTHQDPILLFHDYSHLWTVISLAFKEWRSPIRCMSIFQVSWWFGSSIIPVRNQYFKDCWSVANQQSNE